MRYAMYRCELCDSVPQVPIKDEQEPDDVKLMHCPVCNEVKYFKFVPLTQWLKETI